MLYKLELLRSRIEVVRAIDQLALPGEKGPELQVRTSLQDAKLNVRHSNQHLPSIIPQLFDLSRLVYQMVNLSTITTKKKSGPVLIGILSTRYIADHLAFAFAAIIDIIKPDIIYRALVFLAPRGRPGYLSLADLVDALAPKLARATRGIFLIEFAQ
jgi:hypothetical protein